VESEGIEVGAGNGRGGRAEVKNPYNLDYVVSMFNCLG